MAQAIKTIYRAFETYTGSLATDTTLDASSQWDFPSMSIGLPESSKTIRSATLKFRFRENSTTAKRFDGARIGIQIDTQTADTGSDLTGTGITNTGDPFSAYIDRDVTDYFQTYYTGSLHDVGCFIRLETDTAGTASGISAELGVTYEYDDASATQLKTVLIPLEGLTGSLSTTANTNIRGSTGAEQIPALDTFLPENSKTYKQLYFRIEATDGAAAVTDFNATYAIDGGTSSPRWTMEESLNGSTRYFDIWNKEDFTTNATHDFQAWSSLANRFERFCVTLVATYEFNASATTSSINSIILPIATEVHNLQATTAATRDVFETYLNIQEPSTITMVQSAVRIHYMSTGTGAQTILVTGHGVAGGAQSNTQATYNTTALVNSGNQMFQHRIDVDHGGTPITLARGKNILRCKTWAGGSNTISGVSGYYIINYISNKATTGIGTHNTSTEWQLADLYTLGIGGSNLRTVSSGSSRTPIIPQTNYLLNGSCTVLEYNASATGLISILADISGSEGKQDGWLVLDVNVGGLDGEYGWQTNIFTGRQNWLPYPGYTPTDEVYLEPLSSRDYRLPGPNMQSSLFRWITIHAITYTVSGTIVGSAGGTVNIALLNATTFERYKTTTRTGDGAYSFEWFDDLFDVIVVAWENDSLKGVSKQATPGTGFDIALVSTTGGSGGKITII
jgi:hypothetical protein